jgi:hypothetical protein
MKTYMFVKQRAKQLDLRLGDRVLFTNDYNQMFNKSKPRFDLLNIVSSSQSQEIEIDVTSLNFNLFKDLNLFKDHSHIKFKTSSLAIRNLIWVTFD